MATMEQAFEMVENLTEELGEKEARIIALEKELLEHKKKSSQDIKKLSDELGSIYDKQKRIYADAKSEGREVTKEEENRFDALEVEHSKKSKSIEQLKALNSKNFSNKEEIEKIAEKSQKSVSKVEDEKEMSKRCLKAFLLKGFAGMNNEEKEFVTRAQSTTTNSEGGYTVDTMLSNDSFLNGNDVMSPFTFSPSEFFNCSIDISTPIIFTFLYIKLRPVPLPISNTLQLLCRLLMKLSVHNHVYTLVHLNSFDILL